MAHLQRTVWLPDADGRLPANTPGAHVVFQKVQLLPHAVLGVLLWRLRHPWHELCKKVGKTGFSWLHQAASVSRTDPVQQSPALWPVCHNHHHQALVLGLGRSVYLCWSGRRSGHNQSTTPPEPGTIPCTCGTGWQREQPPAAPWKSGRRRPDTYHRCDLKYGSTRH